MCLSTYVPRLRCICEITLSLLALKQKKLGARDELTFMPNALHGVSSPLPSLRNAIIRPNDVLTTTREPIPLDLSQLAEFCTSESMQLMYFRRLCSRRECRIVKKA